MDNPRPYLITFPDLIYAALLSHALGILDRSLTVSFTSASFVLVAIILMIYDWYGEHWVALQRRVGSLSITLDFVALIIYFGLFFVGSQSSINFVLLLAARALRGIIINFILLRFNGDPGYRERLKSYNISSSMM